MKTVLKLVIIGFVALSISYISGMVVAKANTIKVAVLDTGFDFNSTWPDIEGKALVKPKLCPEGHKDFTSTSINDTHGHGTHIAGLIAKDNDNTNYCLIIIKVYDENDLSNANRVVAGLAHALSLNVDYINISMGGALPNYRERELVLMALNRNIKVVVAAGNDNRHITSTERISYYPAAYDSRLIVVGSVNSDNRKSKFSNYGSIVDIEINGEWVMSLKPNNRYGYLSGTSQATAIHTGNLIKKEEK